MQLFASAQGYCQLFLHILTSECQFFFSQLRLHRVEVCYMWQCIVTYNHSLKAGWYTCLWLASHFLFHQSRILSSVRHGSLLMFDSPFISLMLSLSLILTLFCHLCASSSFFFLASSSWEILEVSSASSVAYTHTHTNGKTVKSAPDLRSLCSVCGCTGVSDRECVSLYVCSYAPSQVNWLPIQSAKNVNCLKYTIKLNLWITCASICYQCFFYLKGFLINIYKYIVMSPWWW